MIDRAKVLSGLKSCADRTGALCRTCPYDFVHNENCMGDMERDALELLKNEPLPVLNVGEYEIYYGDCPHCGERITKKKTRYCPYCGKAVKWE